MTCLLCYMKSSDEGKTAAVTNNLRNLENQQHLPANSEKCLESFVAHLILRLIKINNLKYFSRPSGSTSLKPEAVFVLIIETEVDISVFSLMVASGFYEEKNSSESSSASCWISRRSCQGNYNTALLNFYCVPCPHV